jgi:hypothetical protein
LSSVIGLRRPGAEFWSSRLPRRGTVGIGASAERHALVRKAGRDRLPAGLQRESSSFGTAQSAWSHIKRARLAGRARREGSRSEVRGFQNFEPRTSNFGSRLSRMSRTSSSAVCSVLRQSPDVRRGLSRHFRRSVGAASGPPLLTYCLCGGLAAHIFTPAWHLIRKVF